MVPPSSSSFTGPTETHSFAGILFDLDGTIVDSTNAIVKHWHKLVATFQSVICGLHTYGYHRRMGKELGVDPNVIMATSHGRRSIDTLQQYDPSKANWECKWSFWGAGGCVSWLGFG